jgi:hypothetical protein
MNILLKVLGFLPLVGPVVASIQQIHGDAVAGATKKQLALEALGLAQGVAGTVDPALKPEVDAAGALASSMIDSWVNFYNVVGWTHPASQVVTPVVQATRTSQLAVSEAITK